MRVPILNCLRQKLSYKDAHELFGHLGSLPKCKICKLTKGCMRKILKKVDPFAYSRRQVMRELSYFLLPGTLAHSTDGPDYVPCTRRAESDETG